jgi:hypothetical protein
MIELNLSRKEGLVAVRFRGAVTNMEFVDLAAMIAGLGSVCSLSIYLDWIRVDHWKFVPAQANSVIAWRAAARMIERVAIVHDHHLNRQAAWLAAILRREGVTVRSWRPRNGRAARIWLGLRQLH